MAPHRRRRRGDHGGRRFCMDRVATGSETSDGEQLGRGAAAPGFRCKTCDSPHGLAARGDAAQIAGASGHCTIATQGDATHTVVSSTGSRATRHRAALQLSRSDLRLPGSSLIFLGSSSYS